MIDVLVLGPVAARIDGDPVAVTSAAQRAVLAALAHRIGRSVPVDHLMDVVWGDDPPARPLVSLRSHVSRLRAALGVDVIGADGGAYALTIAPDRVDAQRFDRVIAHADSVTDLDDALALWRGMPFGALADHPFFAAETARLREVRAHGRERRAALLLDAGRADDAIAGLRALAAAHPLREPTWVLLLRALHVAGRQAEAVATAAGYRRRLAEDGLDPSPTFARAEHAVFRSPRPVADPAVAMPRPVQPLVGRDRDLRHLVALLDQRRLVTLVGPGGVGKTVLAREALRRLPLDVWPAQLVEVTADVSVVASVARAVGAARTAPLEQSLRAHLAGRAGVVLLDNAEHVLSGASAVAQLVAGASPELRVVTTSRRPLGVPGEVVVDVEPLAPRDAVTLFRARAADAGRPVADGDTALVGWVCDRVDRLPLAIEMAASRLRGLPLRTLASRLDDRLRLLRRERAAGDPRHRTLTEVIDWSYAPLSDDQRELLEQLSVFAGTFTLETAEAVCVLGTPVDDTLDDLVDRSLVHCDPATARYGLLETVRQFAAERRGDDHPVVRRHVDHHVGRAERIGRGLWGPDDVTWAARFDVEAADIEAAYRAAVALGDADAVGRIALAVYPLVYQRLRADVGVWVEPGLPIVSRAEHPLEPAVRAVVAVTRVHVDDLDDAIALLSDLPDHPAARYGHELLSDIHLYQGDLAAALRHARAAEGLARRGDDPATAAFSRVVQALAHGYDGRRDEGLAIAERGADEATTPMLAAWFDYAVAELRSTREPDVALAMLDRVIQQATRAGWAFLRGVALVTASSVRAAHSEPRVALGAFAQLIDDWRRLGDVTHQWTTLRNLVALLARIGVHEPAARLLGSVAGARTPTYGAEAGRLEQAAEQLRAALGDPAYEAATATGGALDQPSAVRLALDTIADLTAAQ